MRFAPISGGDVVWSRQRHAAVLLLSVAVAAATRPAIALEKASEQVSAFYGSFSHSIPIEVPGFRGLEPKIGLSYSSEGRNGFVGVGWGLAGFSSIQRANAGLGTPKFDSADIYVLDGREMVACQPGSASPSCTSGGNWSTKIESYLKIKFDSGTNTWTVWAKDGTRTILSPIITVPANALVPGGTLRWGVSKTIDTDGNEVVYSWSCPSGDWECYPSQATYNGYVVTFFKETRPDFTSSAAASVLSQGKNRLRSIIVSLPGTSHIRGYQLSYQVSPLTGRSLLVSVQQHGKNLVHDGNGLITGPLPPLLPPQTFTYQDDSIGRSFVDWASAPTRATYTEPVTWANLVNTSTAGSGSSLVKHTGGSSWNAGGDSTRALAAGSGYLEWIASEPSAEGKAAGLSFGNADATLGDIDYAFYEAPTGLLYASENGTLYGPWSRANGDVLRVEVASNIVYFKQNGALRRQSTLTPVFPLRADASIHGVNNTIQSATLSGELIYVNSWCQAILLTGDFNGDGRTDQLCYTTTGGTPASAVALAGQTQFNNPTTWNTGYALPRPVVADFNNDGRADLANHDPWSGDFTVALSTGSTFQSPTLWGNATATVLGGGLASCKVDAASVGAGDFNGDGFLDVFCRRHNAQYPYQFVGLSNGSSAFSFSIFGNFGCDTNGDARVGAIDFDGDGKDDWYCMGATNSTLHVFTSTGTSFQWPAFGTLGFCSYDGYVLGDLNGDGRTDAACRNNGKVALSMGRSFLEQGAGFGGWCGGDNAQVFGADVDEDPATEIVCNNIGDGPTDIQVRQWTGQSLGAAETWRASWCSGKTVAGDWNGDAKTDLYCTSTAAPTVAGTPNRKADLVATVANGLGGRVLLTYTPSSAFLNLNNPPNKYTVTSATTEDGRGWAATTSFTYSEGRFDRVERRFLGFRYARTTLPCLAGEASCPYSETWFNQDLASAGRAERTEAHHGGGNVLAAQSYSYTPFTAAIPRVSLLLSETATYFDGSGCATAACSNKKQTSTDYQYDTFGNRTAAIENGDLANPQDQRSTTWLFHPNTANYLVGLWSKQEHRDEAGALQAAVRMTYDALPAWTSPPTKGHVTTSEAWLASESRWVASNYVYDSFGNLQRTVDPTGVTRETPHNAYPYTFPVSARNLGFPLEVEATVWDPVCGAPAQHTDMNGQVTTFQTDALCRPSRVDLPAGGFEERQYKDFGVNPSMQRVVVETPSANEDSPQYVAQHFDGLGRTFRTVAKGPSLAQSIVSDATFDQRGQTGSQSLPYYANATALWEQYSYDALGRVTQVRHPDNSTLAFLHGLWSLTTTDENGRSETARVDAYGQTVEVERTLDGQPLVTSSMFDSLGQLREVRDPLNTGWFWEYDSLGRMVHQTDPDAGTWGFAYDDAGRLIRTTDAKTQKVEYAFHHGRALNRKTFAAGGALSETVVYSYGASRPTESPAQYNVGRLSGISGPGATELNIGYDNRGRAIWQQRWIDGIEYVARHTFDAGDRLLTEQYPGESPVGPMGYDAAGRLASIPGILTQVLYDASGRPIHQANYNPTVTARTFSAERGFLERIVTGGATGIQDLTYAPDLTGRVTGVTSPHTDETWSYAYDDLYRLEASTNPSNPSLNQTWEYDVVGRIIHNSRIGSYWYGGLHEHAPTAAGANSYTYDANGNMLSGGGRTITWNANDLPTDVNGTQFSYGGLGERIRKATGAAVSRYPFGDEFEVTNGVTTRYVSGGGLGVVAKRTQGQTYWLHNDRTGSIHAITDASGSVVQRRTYRAGGEKIGDTTSHQESRGWLEQRTDDETGLTYLHARYYDPALGLFLSPDPVQADLNTYRYAGGDPINFSDRSGLDDQPLNPYLESDFMELQVPLTLHTGDSRHGIRLQGGAAVAGGGIPVCLLLCGGGGGKPGGQPATPGRYPGHKGQGDGDDPGPGAPGGSLPGGPGGPGAPGPGGPNPGGPGPGPGPGPAAPGPSSPSTGGGNGPLGTAVNILDAILPVRDSELANALLAQAADEFRAGDYARASMSALQGGLATGPPFMGTRFGRGVAIRRPVGLGQARTVSRSLTLAEYFLKPGYREVGANGSGVFKSLDGRRQFRMTTGDITGAHGKIGPHFNFEWFSPNGRVRQNIHVPIVDP
jgi:RHS repeat-associated protein